LWAAWRLALWSYKTVSPKWLVSSGEFSALLVILFNNSPSSLSKILLSHLLLGVIATSKDQSASLCSGVGTMLSKGKTTCVTLKAAIDGALTILIGKSPSIIFFNQSAVMCIWSARVTLTPHFLSDTELPPPLHRRCHQGQRLNDLLLRQGELSSAARRHCDAYPVANLLPIFIIMRMDYRRD
jgi:hypothetical protein